jgi:RNA polymerase sigma-70 factor (ECF subfamily)
MSNRGMARVAEADTTEQVTQDPEAEAGSPVGAWRFRIAVLRHHGIVYRVVHGLLRDRQDAEDVLQETFVRFWQLGNGVHRDREWLIAVARNVALDLLRRRRVLHVTGNRDELAVAAASDERDPEWHARHNELAALLRDRIAALPEPQRSLVILFDVQGLDGAACARILGLNVNQVKVYLHRARRRLRRELEGER